MDDLVRDFLVESGENLDRLDQELVQLESDPSSRDLLSSIFRTIHTIKGSCGFLGFAKLEKVAHAGESLLSRLRDGKLSLNAEIKTTEQDGKKDYASLIENLARLLQQVKEDSVPDQSSAPRPPVRKSAGGDVRYRPPGGKIGGLLVERGFARQEDIATALLEQEKGDRRRLHASTRGRAMSAAAR